MSAPAREASPAPPAPPEAARPAAAGPGADAASTDPAPLDPGALPAPPLPDLPVFAMGDEVYGAREVLASADASGLLAAEVDRIRARLEAAARARSAGRAPPKAAVQREVAAWRVEQRLLAAEDAERWLAARALGARDLFAHAARRIAERSEPSGASPEGPERARGSAERDPDAGLAAEPDAARAAAALELPSALFAELALTGALERLATEAARRARIEAIWRADGMRAPPAALVRSRAAQLAQERAPSFSFEAGRGARPAPSAGPAGQEERRGEDGREGEAGAETAPLDRARFLRQAALFDLRAAPLLDERRLAQALEERRLDLCQAQVLDAVFDGADAAREALLCVDVDGEPLEALAERVGAPASELCLFVEDLPAALARAIVSVDPGGLAGPVEIDGRHHVLRLDARLEPGLDDPEVHARLTAAVLGAALDGGAAGGSGAFAQLPSAGAAAPSPSPPAPTLRWIAWTPDPHRA